MNENQWFIKRIPGEHPAGDDDTWEIRDSKGLTLAVCFTEPVLPAQICREHNAHADLMAACEAAALACNKPTTLCQQLNDAIAKGKHPSR